MSNKSFNILIGIAAYNAEKNIQHLLNALVNQKLRDFSIEILVHSDNSTDKTVDLARQANHHGVKIIDNRERRGFAGVVKYILDQGKNYDAVLILNDDIIIKDENFIIKLTESLRSDYNENIGLVTGNPKPLKPTNFIEKAVTSSYNIYYNLRYVFLDGNNRWTCDGKILMLSKNFLKALELPDDNNDLGNVDGYLYYFCLEKNFKYQHMKDAVVYFKMPSTLKDYLKWDSRNKSNEFLLSDRFGSIVDKEYTIPKSMLIYYSFRELLKNPLGVIFLYFVRFYTMVKAKQISKNFDSKWDVVTTTKDISN